jgi:hypothetical protein
MKFRFAVVSILLYLMTASAAWAQYYSYVASPSGVSYGASPSVLSLEIQTGYPRAIVRKNDWTAFQTTGTMRLYQDGVQIASATQYAGSASVIIPFSWNFTSGTRNFYAMTSTNPYASGSVSVTAGYIPAPPSGVTATAASSSSVAVSWNAVSGATRYILRHTNTGQQTGNLYTTSHTYPGLAAGTNHCFVVLACAGTGFCSAPSAPPVCATTPAEQYKVGVLFYRDKMDPVDNSIVTPMDWTEIGLELDRIRAEIAGGRPIRSGGGREVRLVVQSDVGWADSEPVRGQYNFEWYKKFAEYCRARDIKWTPLLSVHYAPDWILSTYDADRVRDMQERIVDVVDPKASPFLRVSPSSAMWGTDAKAWVQAFVNAMKGAGHFGPTGAIDEVLIGNEMMYPSAMLTSYDAASRAKWRDQYGTTPLPTSLYAANYQQFRANQLSYAIASILIAAKDVLPAHIKVSTKLYPFFFPRSNDTESDEWRGYTDASVGYMNSQFRGMFALDSYPNSYCSQGWSPDHDYQAATSRSALPLYVAEFNRNKACSTALTRYETSKAATDGFKYYRVRGFIFFAWNPNGDDKDLAITPEQKLGLADAMNWVVP